MSPLTVFVSKAATLRVATRDVNFPRCLQVLSLPKVFTNDVITARLSIIDVNTAWLSTSDVITARLSTSDVTSFQVIYISIVTIPRLFTNDVAAP